MRRVGRNDPCPCGSGKKYKRCCLARDEQARGKPASAPIPSAALPTAPDPASSAPPRPPGPSDPSATPLTDIRPYVIVQVMENSPEGERIRQHDPAQWSLRTVKGVAGFSIEEIQARLAEWGIDASREAFLEGAAHETSAWNVSLKWLEGRVPSSLPRFAKDFAGLAACRLWKEFQPDRPSFEMADDWMLEGYDFDGQGRHAEACDCWWRVWEFIRPRLTPAMRQTEDASEMFGGVQSIIDWTQDLALAFSNASTKDTVYAERGIAYHRELLDRFPDEDQLTRISTRCDLAQLLFRTGQAAEGEDILRAVIAEYPDDAMGYLRLSNEFRNTNVPEALALLEAARDRPVQDAHFFHLEERIKELREILQKDEDA